MDLQQLELPFPKGREGLVRFKIGEREVLGTSEDFRESPAEALKLEFEEKMERKRARQRRERAMDPVPTLKNRYDRMKSYCTSNGIDWRISFEDYCRLWEEAPRIYDPDRGMTVDAVEYADRKCKIRATRRNLTDKFVSKENLVLKLSGKIYHQLD